MDAAKLTELVDRQMQLPASYADACSSDRLSFQVGMLTGTLKSLIDALNPDVQTFDGLAAQLAVDINVLLDDENVDLHPEALERLLVSARTLERMAVAVKAALRE